MNTFIEYDNVDDMFAAMRAAEDEANASLMNGHIALRDDTTHTRYWVRLYQDELMIFGEVWSLDESNQREIAAGATEDEAAYTAVGLAESRERGYLYGRAYSIIEPDGEIGSTHVADVVPICKEYFDEAHLLGWQLINADHADRYTDEECARSVRVARALVAHSAELATSGRPS